MEETKANIHELMNIEKMPKSKDDKHHEMKKRMHIQYSKMIFDTNDTD